MRIEADMSDKSWVGGRRDGREEERSDELAI